MTKDRLSEIKEVVRIMGRPYCSELTYKHPYHWDDDYKERWNKWRDSGFEGDEPVPEKNTEYSEKFIVSSIANGPKSKYDPVCQLCLSSIATWT